MNTPANGGRPVRLSERLKQLDDAQYAGGMPGFDLDAAVRGGRRRQRQRRTATSLIGAVATVATIVTGVTLARPGGSPVVPAVSAGRPSVDSRDPAVTYTQQGITVTAHKAGTVVATVSVESVIYDSTRGHLTLTVTATQPFTFAVDEFLWEDAAGTDTAPQGTGPQGAVRLQKVTGPGPQTVVIDYHGVGAGDVIWAPRDTRKPVAAWAFTASGGSVVEPHAHEFSYTQKGDTVTVHQNGQVLATLTRTTTKFDSAQGHLVLSVTATKRFTVRAGQFIWEDPDGGDHAPIDPKRVFHVPAQAEAQRITLDYRKVGRGDVIWSPTGADPAGQWMVSGK